MGLGFFPALPPSLHICKTGLSLLKIRYTTKHYKNLRQENAIGNSPSSVNVILYLKSLCTDSLFF